MMRDHQVSKLYLKPRVINLEVKSYELHSKTMDSLLGPKIGIG